MSTILCIEDEPNLLSQIVEELEASGFTTITATNGREGLEQILKHSPDLTLCDIKMPDMNGMALLSELREKHPRFSDMPFIFLTSFSSRERLIAGLSKGADDYLTKPVDFEILIAKLTAAIRQRERMVDRKRQEQVKLYKALKGDAPPEMETHEAKPADGPRSAVALVGNDESVDKVKEVLDEHNCDVTTFDSGKAFLESYADWQPDAAFVWHETKDINGILISKFAKTMTADPKTKFALLWLDERGPVPHGFTVVDELSDVVTWPCPADQLVEKIENWTAQGSGGR